MESFLRHSRLLLLAFPALAITSAFAIACTSDPSEGKAGGSSSLAIPGDDDVAGGTYGYGYGTSSGYGYDH